MSHPTARVPRPARPSFAFASAVPAVTIDSGESVVVECWDCFSNRLSDPSQFFSSAEDLVEHVGAFNPLSGPIAVREAMPGDSLAITVEAIEIGTAGRYAVTTSTPVQGEDPTDWLAPDVPVTRICKIDGQSVRLPLDSRTVTVPIAPMIGAIGTASPAAEPSIRFGESFGGNMDCPDLKAGATLFLPVNVPGGLVWIGDIHAAMGDGELTGTALETSGDVTVRVDLLQEHPLTAPRLDTPDRIGSLGCQFGAALEENIRTAATDLARRLHTALGLTMSDARDVIGTVGRIRVNQSVHGGFTSAYVSIPRDVIGID